MRAVGSVTGAPRRRTAVPIFLSTERSNSVATSIAQPLVNLSHLSAALAFVSVVSGSSCDVNAQHAGDGHDHGPGDHHHGPASAAGEAELEPVTTTVFGERTLLFIEYPPLVRGTSARFLAHFSVLETGEPVRAGRVTLTIGGTAIFAESPKRDGLFTPQGSVPNAGRMPATLLIESDQVLETLDLGDIVVHENEHDARHAAEDAAGDLPAESLPFLMEQQWKLKLTLAKAEPRTLTRRLVAQASVRTPEGAEAAVTPPLAGRLIAPDGGRLVVTGDAVDAGSVLAFVEPPLGASEIAQIRALELELDMRALDVTQALSGAQARLEFAERERARLSKLREHQLSTQQELDEAERNLRVARSELDGATAMKASLDRLLAERSSRASAQADATLRLPLLSPLAGTVIAAAKVQGESVKPDDVIFRVLDASRVWIEARVSEFDLHRIGDNPSAVASIPALPDRRIEIGGKGNSGALRMLPTLDPATRTALLRCEVSNADGSLKSGMLAELSIALEQVDAAVTIPAEAIVIDQGMPTAYVMLEGELFQKRDLELGIQDRDRVEVRRGIAAGERVATRGAYVVKLAALSPQSFGAGHQH